MADTCRNLAAEIAAGRMSREELGDLMERLEREKEALTGLDNIEGRLMEKGRIIAGEIELAAQIERRNRLRNIVVEQRLWDMIERADAETGDPSLGLRAAMVGVNTPFMGAARSVDAVANGLARGIFGRVIDDLRAEGLEPIFKRMPREMQMEVADVMWDLSLAEPRGVKASPQAKKIAEILHRHQNDLLQRENRAGAFIRNRQGYIVRQSHDPVRMRKAGRDAWIADMRNRLDFEAMEVSPARVDEYLNAAYDNIESGIRVTDDAPPIEKAFKGPGNLAKKESMGRELVFRSARDWFEYNEAYGTGSLVEAYVGGIHKGSQATALLDMFGPNPRAMFDRVRDRALETYKADATKRERFRSGVETLDGQFAEIDGSVNFGASTRAAQISSGIRAVQSMAKLGGAVISALSDVAAAAANRSYHGRSVLDAWGDAFGGLMKGFAPGEQRQAADLLGAGIDGYLGSVMSRFDGADNFTGRTHKALNIFFRWNLLGPWTDASKRGQALIIGRDLGMAADRSFDQLSAAHKRLLSLYGFDARKWEVARLAVREIDGRRYMLPGDVQDARGTPFTGLSERQQQRLRDEVQSDLFALYSNELDVSVPTAGARERAIMRRGYQPGTVAGEALRFMGQFKSFPIAVMTRILGRHTYGAGYRTVGQAFKAAATGENMGLVNFLVGSTFLGYLSMQAKEVMKGRSPRPATPETFVAALAQSGGAGIYGDFLFGQSTRFGNSFLETLAGPTIGSASDAANLLMRTRDLILTGDEDVRGDAIRFAQSNIPFANMFYTKAALDYLVWYQLQEAVNPGYLRRMERRIERDNGQTFWARPSDTVAYGGGFQ